MQIKRGRIDPQAETDTEEQESTDDDAEETTDSQETGDSDDDAEEDEDDDRSDESKALDALASDPEKAKSEILKLRKENGRRRVAAKKAREEAKNATTQSRQEVDEETKSELDRLRARDRERTVGDAVLEVLEEDHPQFAKSKIAKRIVPFVQLDDDDLEDADEVREAAKIAVDEFVADIPLTGSESGAQRRASDEAVGAPGRAPSRGGQSGETSKKRREEMFPSAYGPGKV
jgi:hypothetical protein